MQVTQGRITGAKIIDTQLNLAGFELFKQSRYRSSAFHEGAFRDFEF